jgi:hypothetical protein
MINGPTCKLTLCDIIIENFGIIFTNIHARPSWLEAGIAGHNFGRGPSKDHSAKVWSKLPVVS